MPPLVETLTFSNLCVRLGAAVDWLSSLGISVSKTRMAAYQRAMQHLPSSVGAQEDVYTSLHEANEIVTVYDALCGRGYEGLLRDKRVALAPGTVSYTDEDASANNRARNFAFELQVAARIALSGLSLDWDLHSDVAVTVGPGRLMIECIRPLTADAIPRNVVKARRQLKVACRRRGDSVRRFGIIALDVTKFSNPEFSLLAGLPSQQAAPLLSGLLEGVWLEHASLWGRLAASRVIGVLFRISILAHLQGESMLTYCQQWALAALPGVRDVDTHTLQQLSRQLETATIA